MAITFSVSKKKLLQESADAYAFFVAQDFDHKIIKEFVDQFPLLPEYIKKQSFTGKAQTFISVPVDYNGRLVNLLVLGLGKQEKKYCNIESYRRALALAIRFMQKNKLAALALSLPSSKLFACDDQYLAEQTAIIAAMTDYIFDTFKEVENGRSLLSLKLVISDHNISNIKLGLDRGTIIGDCVNDARQWVNLPANIMHPDELSSQARQLAKQYGFSCRVFSESEIQKMGMGGLAAVSSGSEQDCCLIVMEYKTDKKNAPTIGFVGKGITYDSGGLSLKPSKSMETMKDDMAGAAAVIATMKVLAQLKPAVNVIGIVPVAENLPSGVAAKPGDIVRMYDGTTVEIKNTDAEGRIILADALAYIVKHYKPEIIIDIATLTTACRLALGPFFTGLLTEHDDLSVCVQDAAKIAGEPVWRLPLTDDYKKAMDGIVSDLCNTGDAKYLAGATTAAVFLQHFVGDIPWLHLDIAGTAFDVPNIPYYSRETATGVGVRLLTQVVLNWYKS